MKIKKPTKKTLIIALTGIFVVVSAGVFYLLFVKEKTKDFWYDSNWSYRKTIYIDNIPREYRGFEEDVLIEIDTAALIKEEKLVEDCRDIRFVDEDNSSTLEYWIEGGCNTDQTQIWVKVKLPKSSEKIIYTYYGNELAIDNQEKWNGAFITMRLKQLPNGCDMTSNFEALFIRGSDTNGEIGGIDSHIHTLFNYTETSNCENLVTIAVPEDETNCDIKKDNMITLKSSDVSNILPHEDMYFYRNFNGFLPPKSVILFDKPSPENWSTFEPLVGKYPRGEDVKDIEVSNSHVHYPSCVNGNFYVKDGPEKYLTLKENSPTIATPTEPPYYNVNYISNSDYAVIPKESIIMITELPPLGWKRYEELDGYFPKGSTTNFKKTGGNDNHTHTVNLSIEIKNSTQEKLNLVETTLACLDKDIDSPQKSSEESLLPINLGMLFGQKKGELIGSMDVRFGEEESGEKNILGTSTTAPSKPTSLETEGETNPTDITDTTPEFTAIFNHPDYP